MSESSGARKWELSKSKLDKNEKKSEESEKRWEKSFAFSKKNLKNVLKITPLAAISAETGAWDLTILV